MSTTTKSKKSPKAAKTAKAPVAKRSPFPKKIGMYILYVTDMKKGIEFYKNTLGLKCEYESSEWTQFSAGIEFALHIMEEGCTTSCGATTETARIGKETGLVFNVENTKETYDAFKAAGIKVRGEPVLVCESTRCFSFEDTFGNVLSVSGK